MNGVIQEFLEFLVQGDPRDLAGNLASEESKVHLAALVIPDHQVFLEIKDSLGTLDLLVQLV